MNVLITGGNGYIAKGLNNALKGEHQVTAITRKDFDLTEREATNLFFKDKFFDVVIHCAVTGGHRLKKDDWSVMDTNLSMYYNLLGNRERYKKFIHFGSGAELFMSEEPYGLSKNVISKSISDKENFYNIRIFGLFDENELETRFIKSNIIRYIKKEPLEILNNKTMDFFYMKDLVSLVNYYILNHDLKKEIDCCYESHPSLTEIATIINKLDLYDVDIKIHKDDFNKSYFGNYYDLPIKYVGIERGIIEVYNKLKQN
jgi:nucleoside-diphosphate-sugar epimerase